MKTCSRCLLNRVLSDYTKNSAKSDGLSDWCRDCLRAYRISKGLQRPVGWERKTHKPGYWGRAKSKWEKAHPDKAAELRRSKERRQYARKMRDKYGPDYEVGSPENLRRRHAMLDPAERKRRFIAGSKLRKAVERGKIERQPCFECGCPESQAHHPDYDSPLSVTWLCHKHHHQIHAEFGQ